MQPHRAVRVLVVCRNRATAPPAGASPAWSPTRANDADAFAESGVAQLMRMGFSRDQAAQALLKTGGNVEEAASILGSR